jgi:hypothetical protein
MLGVLLHAFAVEGPREVLIGFACGVGVTATLSFLGHHKLVKPARERHAEVMGAHRQHARQAGYELEPPK